MEFINVMPSAQHLNQRIGCCLQVILITWLLWQPMHCNSNRVNEGNRSTKSFVQQLNQNHFDPKPKHYSPLSSSTTTTTTTHSTGAQIIANRTNNSSNLDNLSLNYLLSVLQHDERQAIFNNVIHYKSDTTSHSMQTPVPKKDDSIVDNDIELPVEERRDIEDANKLSLFSSSLNVIDVSPQDTQLAHSVLIVHKPKPNKTVKPTIRPHLQVLPQHSHHSQQSVQNLINKNPVTSPIITTTTTTESYPTPVRNNHRPMFIRPFPGRVKTTTTTTTSTTPTTITTPKTTTSLTTTLAKNETQTETQTTDEFNTTFPTTNDSLEDIPIIINSNHKKQSFPQMFTRQKLTSTEYALIFTTPDSYTDTDKTGFTEVPTVVPTYTFRPPYVTTFNPQKRPPMKIITVNANKVKQPDDIVHEGITVLDPPFHSGHPMKLPPNTTIIHKNLIVPMKDGRPKPVFPSSSTTQYPVYPMVAGITGWHTPPTTPFTFPIVTTSNPYSDPPSLGSTVTDLSDSDNTVTAQSVNRPTIISGPQVAQTVQTLGQTSHFVTVTPIKTTSDTSVAASNTFLVTQSAQTPRPTTSTTGYVNAIWAPPMPIHARPVHAVQAQPATGSWFSPVSNIFSFDPSSGSMFSFISILKTFLFTILVFFLPPLTLAAALMGTTMG